MASAEEGEGKARRRTIRRLVAQLASGDAERRAQAEGQLYELSSEGMAELIAELERMVRNAKRLPWIIAGSIIGHLLVMMIGCHLLFGRAPSGPVVVGMVVMIAPWVRQFQRGRNGAAGVLSNLEDLRAVGPLAEAMLRVEPVVQRDVGRALKRLLPKLQPGDSGLLGRAGREALHHLLFREEEALVRAVIEALGVVGDATSIRPLLELTEAWWLTTNSHVKAEAAKCAVILEERAKREAQQAVLLRPSAGAAEEALLRPAASASSGDEGRLLHVSDGQQSVSGALPGS